MPQNHLENRENSTAVNPAYLALLEELKGVLAQGRGRAEAAVRQAVVETQWALGQRLRQAMAQNRVSHGDAWTHRLAGDLGVHPDTLYQAVRFAKAFGTLPTYPRLTWSHYRLLARIDEPEPRTWYAELASEGGLGVARLNEAIASKRHLETTGPKKRSPGTVSLKRPQDPRYVYRATLDRVVDGDTLVITLDLGFGVLKKERLRLAGVDTPPGSEPAGLRATEFVRRALPVGSTLCVQTKRTDRYGRYIAHVMYSKKQVSFGTLAKSGAHLNQQLLDRGLAVPA